ncbi:hypothetical protein [Breoghania sp. L-A4]|uniref:hypothetical protein n=1 Tax=Breoghania sp. L-A4 TaxID=2304600 RepID=UPI000E35BB5E|nr:hypothetical protein [Breoghania sp. L-A4]AXS38856.1 hypothetical protein D1F64_00750 [Breoghania sp. L-A4]
MPFLVNIPLTVAPLLVYNIIAYGLVGNFPGDPWTLPVMTAQLASGARWTMLLGDLMILSGLVFLFIEIVKATRVGSTSVLDHILSALVFAIYLVEFLIVPAAASSVFFLLLVISLVDLIAGFTVTIHGARRDVAFGPNGHM